MIVPTRHGEDNRKPKGGQPVLNHQRLGSAGEAVLMASGYVLQGIVPDLFAGSRSR